MFPLPEHQNLLEKSFNEQFELSNLLPPINPYSLIPLSPPSFIFDSPNDLKVLPPMPTPIVQAQHRENCGDRRPSPLLNNTKFGGKGSGSPKIPVRKDRHSKINTASGLRDRRMRLSLEVARKFFNLQDMLGFDKPSKTVLWLLTESKVAIKELTAASKQKLSANCVDRNLLSNSDGEDSSTVSHPKGKARSKIPSADKKIKIRIRSAAKKPIRKTAFHSIFRREERARARARARERTSEKKMKSILISASPKLSTQFDTDLEKVAGMHDLESSNSLENFPKTVELFKGSSSQLVKQDSDQKLRNVGMNQIQMFEACHNDGGVEIDAVTIFSDLWDFDRAFSEDSQLQYRPLQIFCNTHKC